MGAADEPTLKSSWRVLPPEKCVEHKPKLVANLFKTLAKRVNRQWNFCETGCIVNRSESVNISSLWTLSVIMLYQRPL
jgi:hypothetical protein